MNDFRHIDAHCHPNLGALKKDQDEVIARMKDEEVLGIVVGVDKETSKDSTRLAEQHEHLYATVGLHPNDTPEETFEENLILYDKLARHPKVVAVGECGLDHFRIKGDIEKEKERQWGEFKKQVEFALKHDLPLMIHCRPSKDTDDAYEDILEYLEPKKEEVGEILRGNMHFFVGGIDVARRFWNIGFSTSFTGVITFSRDYDEVIKECPEHLYLSETDAPFAAPEPHRGKRNEPVYVKYVVSKIAEIRGESEETVQEQILKNAKHMFKIGM